MRNSPTAAEATLRRLIARTNRCHSGARWRDELTGDIENIAVASTADGHTRRIHPCWLRDLVAQGEFRYCVAGEIAAWYLLERLTARGPVASVN